MTSEFFDSILQVVLAADHFQTRKEWDYHPIKKFPFLSLAIMKLPSAPQHTYENNRVRNFAVLYTYTPYYVLFMKCISLHSMLRLDATTKKGTMENSSNSKN